MHREMLNIRRKGGEKRYTALQNDHNQVCSKQCHIQQFNPAVNVNLAQPSLIYNCLQWPD